MNYTYTWDELKQWLPSSAIDVVHLNLTLRSPEFKERYCGKSVIPCNSDPSIIEYDSICTASSIEQIQGEIDSKNNDLALYKDEKAALDMEYEQKLKQLKLRCLDNKYKLNICKEHLRIKTEGLHDKLESLRCVMMSYENTLRYVLRICFHFI